MEWKWAGASRGWFNCYNEDGIHEADSHFEWEICNLVGGSMFWFLWFHFF